MLLKVGLQGTLNLSKLVARGVRDMKLWIIGLVLFLSACAGEQTRWIEMHGDENDATIRIGMGIQPRWATTLYPHVALPPPVDLWLKKDN